MMPRSSWQIPFELDGWFSVYDIIDEYQRMGVTYYIHAGELVEGSDSLLLLAESDSERASDSDDAQQLANSSSPFLRPLQKLGVLRSSMMPNKIRPVKPSDPPTSDNTLEVTEAFRGRPRSPSRGDSDGNVLELPSRGRTRAGSAGARSLASSDPVLGSNGSSSSSSKPPTRNRSVFFTNTSPTMLGPGSATSAAQGTSPSRAELQPTTSAALRLSSNRQQQQQPLLSLDTSDTFTPGKRTPTAIAISLALEAQTIPPPPRYPAPSPPWRSDAEIPSPLAIRFITPPEDKAPPPPASSPCTIMSANGAVALNSPLNSKEVEWVINDLNSKFQYCPTYPPLLCLPLGVDVHDINKSIAFRSKGRLPVLVWKRAGKPAALLRCSQPLVGMQANRSTSDEKLLRLVNSLNPSHRLQIVDARSKAAATANYARGAGMEGARYTDFVDIHFMSIENIHTMRECHQRLFDLLKNNNTESSWLSLLESTGWLKHIRQLLAAADFVVQKIESGCSVLVHCSDGWDRTPQITALACLILDPYYRTLSGFQVLIEKEW